VKKERKEAGFTAIDPNKSPEVPPPRTADGDTTSHELLPGPILERDRTAELRAFAWLVYVLCCSGFMMPGIGRAQQIGIVISGTEMAMIGPFRAGKVNACGLPGTPAGYIWADGGSVGQRRMAHGVKTIFDKERRRWERLTLAPSNPNII